MYEVDKNENVRNKTAEEKTFNTVMTALLTVSWICSVCVFFTYYMSKNSSGWDIGVVPVFFGGIAILSVACATWIAYKKKNIGIAYGIALSLLCLCVCFYYILDIIWAFDRPFRGY